MRTYGMIAVAAMIGLAGLQSILGGTPEGSAARAPVLAEADLCTVGAMTLPVIREETRTVETAAAHSVLEVTPAVYGSREDNLVVVPEHRAGATFFTESKRVIVAEPTRRLRAVAPVFETVEALPATVIRPRVENGKLVEEAVPLLGVPATRIVVEKARIEAVRINAGLEMREIKVIDTDGDGARVPAETVPVTVRTVEAHPVVKTTQVPAVSETVTVEVVEAPAATVDVAAVCTMAGRGDLIGRVRAVLLDKGLEPGVEGAWSARTIDAMAAAQAAETGYVSPFLLVETLRAWVPEVRVPVS